MNQQRLKTTVAWYLIVGIFNFLLSTTVNGMDMGDLHQDTHVSTQPPTNSYTLPCNSDVSPLSQHNEFDTGLCQMGSMADDCSLCTQINLGIPAISISLKFGIGNAIVTKPQKVTNTPFPVIPRPPTL